MTSKAILDLAEQLDDLANNGGYSSSGHSATDICDAAADTLRRLDDITNDFFQGEYNRLMRHCLDQLRTATLEYGKAAEAAQAAASRVHQAENNVSALLARMQANPPKPEPVDEPEAA